jgi:hypothetical protein
MPNGEYPITEEIADLADYLALVKIIQREWEAEQEGHHLHELWFRGQMDDWPLLPKVLRTVKDPDTGGDVRHNELGILIKFSSLYRNYIADRFDEESVELLAFMQHNGVPTCFLDWTESALMGLYFAVAEVKWNSQGTPVVWIMNPGRMNDFTHEGPNRGPFIASVPFVQARIKVIGFKSDEEAIEPEFWKRHPDVDNLHERQLLYPIAFYPTSSNNLRLATQKGCFTVHGIKLIPIETLFKGTASERFLKKVIIKARAAGQIREELRVMGVTPRSVFPDLYGLSQELNGREHMIIWRE